MTFNFFLQSSVEVDLSIMWITIAGFLVFFMHAGFTLVEAGFTQAKNAVNIAMKNLMAISVGTIVYWFIGYSLMYGETSNGFSDGLDFLQRLLLMIYFFKQCLLPHVQQLSLELWLVGLNILYLPFLP